LVKVEKKRKNAAGWVRHMGKRLCGGWARKDNLIFDWGGERAEFSDSNVHMHDGLTHQRVWRRRPTGTFSWAAPICKDSHFPVSPSPSNILFFKKQDFIGGDKNGGVSSRAQKQKGILVHVRVGGKSLKGLYARHHLPAYLPQIHLLVFNWDWANQEYSLHVRLLKSEFTGILHIYVADIAQTCNCHARIINIFALPAKQHDQTQLNFLFKNKFVWVDEGNKRGSWIFN
jgi:hypothetical protein